MEDQLLTPKQAAEYLGITYGTLAQGRSTGCVEHKISPKYFKISPQKNGQIRYKKSDLDQWLEDCNASIEPVEKKEQHHAELQARRTLVDIFEKQFKSMFSVLTAREKDVIKRRLGIGCECETLECIGKSLNITRERVRQIEAKAVEKMKNSD